MSACKHLNIVLYNRIDWFSWCASLTQAYCVHCWLRSNPQRVFPQEWVCQITHRGATKHLCAVLILQSSVLTQPSGPWLSLCSSLRGFNPDSDTSHTGQRGDARTTGDLLIHQKPKANSGAATGGWCWQPVHSLRAGERKRQLYWVSQLCDIQVYAGQYTSTTSSGQYGLACSVMALREWDRHRYRVKSMWRGCLADGGCEDEWEAKKRKGLQKGSWIGRQIKKREKWEEGEEKEGIRVKD